DLRPSTGALEGEYLQGREPASGETRFVATRDALLLLLRLRHVFDVLGERPEALPLLHLLPRPAEAGGLLYLAFGVCARRRGGGGRKYPARGCPSRGPGGNGARGAATARGRSRR